MGTARRGRPAGLLLNPVALDHLLGQQRTQTWLAGQAKITTGALSEMMVGSRGASRAVADRLAKALGCPVGVIFPETVGFTTSVRYFTASGADS